MNSISKYLFPVALALLLAACATPYGIYADRRPIEVLKDDASLRSSVSDKLKQEGYTGVNELSVHAYYGKVFLTGELPKNQRDKAISAARGVKGVNSVTAHWFVPLKADSSGDAALTLRLEKNLVVSDGVTSSRIDYVVNSGRVVLLGVVESDKESAAAIKTARSTNGVRSVTSYLFKREDPHAPVYPPQQQKGQTPQPQPQQPPATQPQAPQAPLEQPQPQNAPVTI